MLHHYIKIYMNIGKDSTHARDARTCGPGQFLCNRCNAVTTAATALSGTHHAWGEAAWLAVFIAVLALLSIPHRGCNFGIMGRPSKCTPEIVATICRRLSVGEPLAVICRDEGMPNPGTVRDWMAAREDVTRAIAGAREDGEDFLAAECLAIADTPQEGVETTINEDGTSEKRGDMLGHRKLRIETRLKLLAKWNPKKWGEKVDHHHGGAVNIMVDTGVPPAADA